MHRAVVLVGPPSELGELAASLVAPFRATVLRAASADEVSRLAEGGTIIHLAILLPAPAEQTQESTETLRALHPPPRILKLARFAAPRPDSEPGFAAGDLALDASDLSELIGSVLRAVEAPAEPPPAGDRPADLVMRLAVALTALYTSHHEVPAALTQVVEDAVRLGRQMGLGQNLLDEIGLATALRDIGMARLERGADGTPERVESHCRHSAVLIAALRLPWRLGPIVLAHHEHYDGFGYPKGLRGRDIPVGARILAVADAFHAMTLDKPTGQGLSGRDALAHLEHQAGRQFDPEVVELFIAMIRERPSEPVSRGRVAIANHDPITREALSLRLRRAGYEVVDLPAAGDWLAALRSQTPDAVIVSAGLGDTRGLEFLHWIRADRKLRTPALVALVAAEDGPSGRVAALELGADEVLVMPVKPRDLIARLGAAARRRLPARLDDSVTVHAGEGIRGRLDERPVAELCQMLRNGRKTAELVLLSDEASGRVSFLDGVLVDAQTTDARGEEAFLALAQLRSGRYVVSHGVGPRARTVSRGLDHLLLEAHASSAEMPAVMDARPVVV